MAVVRSTHPRTPMISEESSRILALLCFITFGDTRTPRTQREQRDEGAEMSWGRSHKDERAHTKGRHNEKHTTAHTDTMDSFCRRDGDNAQSKEKVPFPLKALVFTFPRARWGGLSDNSFFCARVCNRPLALFGTTLFLPLSKLPHLVFFSFFSLFWYYHTT